MLAFAIKSAIYLSIMYIPYMLMLRNESFFRFNRLLLLCIMLLSLILPFCDFHFLAIEGNPLHGGVIEIGMPMAIVEGQSPSSHIVTSGIDWQLTITYIYIIGIIVTASVKLFQLFTLYRSIRKGVLWQDMQDGVTVYCHANNVVPFSWFSTIVISEQDYRQNAAEIIGHEMGHIHHHHSLDIIFVNLVEVVQWMNPFVWLLASSLRNVHEYEADDAVLRSGVNARQYQTLLIRKAVGSSSYTFANSFNHSQLKKRFTMMFRKQSNPWMRTKALYTIPVAVIALSAFATPELNNRVDAVTEKATSVIASKGTTNSVLVQEKVRVNDAPVVESESVTEEKISILKDQEMIRKYTDEKNVSAAIVADLESKDDDSDKLFAVVESKPQFPGGNTELMKYLSTNIRYPKEAIENNAQGCVIVQFIVERDGTVSSPTVKRSVDPSLDAEAVRVVSSMPKWIPGTQKGKPVRVKYVIPVTFKL